VRKAASISANGPENAQPAPIHDAFCQVSPVRSGYGVRTRRCLVTTVIACCGLDCAACPAFHAGERLTTEERQQVADRWSTDFGGSFTAADIDCVGCNIAGGPKVAYCSSCEIRLCGESKGYTTCAECPDYACEKLTAFFKETPDARANLEALRPA
jgi:hypothetical protein